MPIKTAAGLGMALISSEHFFSTFLSSPWTTEKFVENEEEKAKIRKLYIYATALSLITAGIISAILDEWWPLIAVIVLSLIYIIVYERALAKKL